MKEQEGTLEMMAWAEMLRWATFDGDLGKVFAGSGYSESFGQWFTSSVWKADPRPQWVANAFARFAQQMDGNHMEPMR